LIFKVGEHANKEDERLGKLASLEETEPRVPVASQHAALETVI
jgi:hypothetical protein